MQLQLQPIMMTLDEEQCAAENRSKLRVVNPHRKPRIHKEEPQNQNVVVQTEMEIAYNWLMNELRTNYNSHMSERSIFGTVSFEVPIGACNPDLVAEIMAANGVPLVQRKRWYNLKTGEAISERFTYDTPVLGVIHMPI